MGVNLLQKAQKSFEKHIDDARREVSSPGLFDAAPSACPRRFLADPAEGAAPREGDRVGLEMQNGDLIGIQGQSLVFRTRQPPNDIVAHVLEKGGVAEGEIVSVNDMSGVLEIDLC